MALQDFHQPRPTTQFGSDLRNFIISRGRKPEEFATEQEASIFKRQSELNDAGVMAGLTPDDIQLQSKQLGLPVDGPLANATVAAPAVDMSVPAYARGYAESFKAKEAAAAQRLAPAGGPGSSAALINASFLGAQEAPEEAGPLAEASVAAPKQPAPTASVDAAGEYVPAPPDHRKLGVDVDPLYQGIVGEDPRQVVFKRSIPKLASKLTADWVRKSGTTSITYAKQAQLLKEAEFEAARQLGYQMKADNQGRTVGYVPPPLKPDKRQITNEDGDTFEVDVMTDEAGRIVRVNSASPNLVKPGTLTLNQRAFDKAAVKDIQDYDYQRAPTMAGNITALEHAVKRLEGEAKKEQDGVSGTGMASGPLVGLATKLPGGVGRALFRTNADIKRDIYVAGISGLRAALGAAFTAKENEDFLARSFDDFASDEENLRRAQGLVAVLKEQKAALDARSTYWKKHGTLKGYDGPQPFATADDIYAARDASLAAEGIPPVGSNAPAAEKAAGNGPSVRSFLQRPGAAPAPQ